MLRYRPEDRRGGRSPACLNLQVPGAADGDGKFAAARVPGINSFGSCPVRSRYVDGAIGGHDDWFCGVADGADTLGICAIDGNAPRAADRHGDFAGSRAGGVDTRGRAAVDAGHPDGTIRHDGDFADSIAGGQNALSRGTVGVLNGNRTAVPNRDGAVTARFCVDADRRAAGCRYW